MKAIFGGRKNQEQISKKPAGSKQQRFCEICGISMGAMTSKDWDAEGRIGKACAGVYASSLEIERDAANQALRAKGQFRERDDDGYRISRFI
jgi:hypothetical protein